MAASVADAESGSGGAAAGGDAAAADAANAPDPAALAACLTADKKQCHILDLPDFDLSAPPRKVKAGPPVGPLRDRFEKSYSLSERLMKLRTMGEREQDPMAHCGQGNHLLDLKDSLQIMAAQLEEQGPRGRWVFQNAAATESLVVDVLGVKIAPDEVCELRGHCSGIDFAAAEAKAGGGGGGGETDEGQGGERVPNQPLLIVRYHYCDSGPADAGPAGRVLMATYGDFAVAPDQRAGHPSGVHSRLMKATSGEIRQCRERLEANKAKVSARARAAWESQSRHNRSPHFALSFLVPVTNRNTNVTPAENVCAVCGKSCALTCSRCKSAHYCSRECQRSHWKVHKKVCSKTPDAVKAGSPEEAGISEVVPIGVTPEMAGMAFMSINSGSLQPDGTTSTAAGNPQQGIKSLAGHGDKKVRNPYGDRKFMVKVQVPMGMGGAAPLMCYDKTRTVQTMIAGASPAGRQIAHLARTHPRSVRGMKGYFWARLEGNNLRIFTNDLAKAQAW
eukprot:g2361.t1